MAMRALNSALKRLLVLFLDLVLCWWIFTNPNTASIQLSPWLRLADPALPQPVKETPPRHARPQLPWIIALPSLIAVRMESTIAPWPRQPALLP